MTYTATYSPDDNKLRLYALGRLDAETYAKIHAAGFKWAPKQELFVAPLWTPAREDLLLELAGAIDDEDKSLVTRAEERAERFEDYSEARTRDGEAARKAVDRICEGIPLGQPILVGHHSEKHARRDCEKINGGMRATIKAFDQADYWRDRAAGALRHAAYKERPDVRARRIKKLESELRKLLKTTKEANAYSAQWRKVGAPGDAKKADGSPASARDIALYIANHDHVSRCFPLADYPRDPPASQYEGSMSLWSALDGNIITAEQAAAIALRVHERGNGQRARWIAHYEGRLIYERAMLAEAGGTAADKVGPEQGGGCKCWASPRGGWSYIVKVNQVSVTLLDNWGNGGGNFRRLIPFDKLSALMSKADVETKRAAGELIESAKGTSVGFFVRGEAGVPAKAPIAPMPAPDPAIAAMKDLLKEGGAKAVAAPQLFPTPPALAARVVALASLAPGADVLEPSAGTGALLAALPEGLGRVVAVEHSLMLAQHLRRGYPAAAVHGEDFLQCNGALGRFDAIVMNPPFERGADIAHIRHAISFLKPGGRLVAICANGPRQREALMPLAASWEA